MPKFPTKEADIVVLAKKMMFGFQHHGEQFPSVQGPALAEAYYNYLIAKKSFVDARAANKLASEEKKDKFDNLIKVMKKRLKKAQTDVCSDPVKLSYIGWGPKAIAQPIEIPIQPSNLTITDVGQGRLSLAWEKPKENGIVRNYIVERRQQQDDGSFEQWRVVDTAYKSNIKLSKQPSGYQIEYRVKAANTSGQSQPSNTISVVL